MKYIKSLIIISLFILIIIGIIFTRPEYTLLTGNKCITCHYNHNGGGARNVLGTYSRNEICIVDDESIKNFSSGVNEATLLFDGLLQWGLDYRFQTARLGDPSNSKREYFLMQLSNYVTLNPFNWLKIGAQYNFLEPLHDLFKDDKDLSKFLKLPYPGQTNYGVFAIIQPGYSYPDLKIGYIPLPIGMKNDDHTNLVRQAVVQRPSIILPPDNNELGAELNYEGLKWATFTGGLYASKTMSKITISDKNSKFIPIVSRDYSVALKAVFLPRFEDNLINTFIGGSLFINGDYSILDGFAGAGITDEVCIYGEFTHTKKNELRETNNFMVELFYTPITALGINVRYERGTTYDLTTSLNYFTNQIVLGLSGYPLPNIELRPEFRIFDRESAPSYAHQWAVQLHFFY